MFLLNSFEAWPNEQRFLFEITLKNSFKKYLDIVWKEENTDK